MYDIQNLASFHLLRKELKYLEENKIAKLDEIHDSLQNMMSAHNCWHETRGKEKIIWQTGLLSGLPCGVCGCKYLANAASVHFCRFSDAITDSSLQHNNKSYCLLCKIPIHLLHQ